MLATAALVMAESCEQTKSRMASLATSIVVLRQLHQDTAGDEEAARAEYVSNENAIQAVVELCRAHLKELQEEKACIM